MNGQGAGDRDDEPHDNLQDHGHDHAHETVPRSEHATWIVEVRDPHVRITDAVRTSCEAALTDLCANAGCRDLQHHVADDGKDRQHRWSVVLPALEHHRRNDAGVPYILAAFIDYLRTQLPAQADGWAIAAHHHP